MALPMDSLVNQAAKFWYVSGERGTVPLIVATEETPIPYSPTLEDASIPNGETIARAVRERLGVSAAA